MTGRGIAARCTKSAMKLASGTAACNNVFFIPPRSYLPSLIKAGRNTVPDRALGRTRVDEIFFMSNDGTILANFQDGGLMVKE
jgi:hypothetical protein